jgi:hypothetical protein
VPVKVLSNQENKQPGTTNNALKMQRVLFHKSHDIKNKLPIIIHVDKMSVQEETNFSQTKPRVFLLKPFTLKPIKIDGHLLTYLHQMTNIANIGANHFFSKKKPESCKISKANYFKLTSKQFLFSKCKIKISRFILDKYSFTKLKIREMREWSLKNIICLSC